MNIQICDKEVETFNHKGFKFYAEYDSEDDIYVGRVLDIEDIISFHSETMEDFYSIGCEAIDSYLDCINKLV